MNAALLSMNLPLKHSPALRAPSPFLGGGESGASRSGSGTRFANTRSWILSLLAGALLLTPAATAAYIVTVGDHALLPNQSGQQVSLFVENTGGSVDYGGLNFSVRVADGTTGPALTDVDLLTGTPFDGANFGGQFADGGNTPRQQFWSVISLTSELPVGPSLLATLTFDTTGLGSGEWALSLSGLGLPATTLLDYAASEYPVTLAAGTLNVFAPVPEPETLGLVAAVGLLGFGLWRRATR